MVDEDDGVAVVNVRLLNEIENEFLLNYRTEEIPGHAEGTPAVLISFETMSFLNFLRGTRFWRKQWQHYIYSSGRH